MYPLLVLTTAERTSATVADRMIGFQAAPSALGAALAQATVQPCDESTSSRGLLMRSRRRSAAGLGHRRGRVATRRRHCGGGRVRAGIGGGGGWGTGQATLGPTLQRSPEAVDRGPERPERRQQRVVWLTGTGASSARLYWESIELVSRWFTDPIEVTVTVPTGCTVFPREVPRPSRRLAEQRFTNIVHWGEPERGGHFGAWEQPDRFLAEVRAAATAMQSGPSQASGQAD
jgi:hypothetical protein